MAAFGRTAGGRTVNAPYRPPLVDFSFDVSASRSPPSAMDAPIPLPPGWSFGRDRTQLLPEPSPASFAEFRALFGLVASIGDDESTDSPFLFSISTKLFFRYGAPHAENVDSFVFDRVNDWPSNAVIEKHYQSICMGMPVTGLRTPTDSKYASAQLN